MSVALTSYLLSGFRQDNILGTEAASMREKAKFGSGFRLIISLTWFHQIISVELITSISQKIHI